MERYSHGAGSAANLAYRAYDKLACSDRANDKLARLNRTLCGGSKTMISWPARAGRYVVQQGNEKLARSSRALFGAARQ